ncbi:hypothetical protein Sjap_002211 [Stephania japonica]|uniref:EF-hand domain-containing protein n=1 Tax=Stephania japonica TaxID=461633 RepID=A0AAP0KLG2_9MAGN
MSLKRFLRSASSGFSSKARSRSVSRSDPQSASSGSTSSDESSASASASAAAVPTTPTTVLPPVYPADFSDYELSQAYNLVTKGVDASGCDVISAADLELLLSRSVSDDFAAALVADPEAPSAADHGLRDAFRVFDADGDGKISAEELWEVFAAIGDEGCTLEDCRRMISGVDSDGDGFVCFEDFQRMMMMEQQNQQQLLHR